MARNYAARSVAVSEAHNTALAPFCFMTTNSKCAARGRDGHKGPLRPGFGFQWVGWSDKQRLPRVTAWHPARWERRPRGIYLRSAGAEGKAKARPGLPAPATLRASPSGVGFHWEQLGRLSAAKDTLAKPAHGPPRSRGETRKSSVSSVPGRASGLRAGPRKLNQSSLRLENKAQDSTHAC